jgi:hypothetical protein
MKKLLVLSIFIGLFSWAPQFIGKDKVIAGDPILNALLDFKDTENLPRTGDILLWSNTSIDSLTIQALTDGRYSHCGLIYRDSENQIWVMDIHPRSGLRTLPLHEYVHPKGFELVNIGLMRYQGTLNQDLLKIYIDRLLSHKDHIVFDGSMIDEGLDMNLDLLEKNSYSLYCSELIFKILAHCTSGTVLYENDYDRVMSKWTILSSSKTKILNPFDSIKLLFFNFHLKKLKTHSNKILISPNGFVRSGAFKILKEIRDLAEPHQAKKFLTRFPKTQNTSINSGSSQR